MGSLSRVVRQLGAVSTEVNPALQALITREPGFAAHLVTIEPQLAFLGANLPKLLKGIARSTQEGAYINVYTCDLNALGFFPGLNDVTPVIVNAASPGNQAQYTPKCRSMANG
jgi:phospholipid/cholesterol/gamma-HCH transport system substrate-binding protein